ncbi:hypothetical protein pb186bvf_013721 [Paramecium bursaria]
MVYSRLIKNTVKEYTPTWFKTLPYQQSTKPTFQRSPQIVSNFNSKVSTKAFWRFVQRNIQAYPWVWQLLIFANGFIVFSLCYYPWVWAYQFNNKRRSLDYALEQEKQYKASKPQEEE